MLQNVIEDPCLGPSILPNFFSTIPVPIPYNGICSSSLGLQPFKLLAVSEYATFHILTAFSVTSFSPQFCYIPLVFQISFLDSLPYLSSYIFT